MKREASISQSAERALTPVLSFQGEYHRARRKGFAETVVFVPFFGGKKSNLKRHVEFVSQLGFDSVVFNLNFKLDPLMTSAQSGFGLKHIWADQIEKILNEVPGDKIVYSFSNPSASAIEAIARRGAYDVKALICDGGPSAQFFSSMLNYYKFESPIRLAPLRWMAALGGSLLWHPRFAQALRADLRAFPAGFRVLTIRGWKDPLISPDQIDAVFEPHHQLKWSRLSLPKGGHVNGLKDFRDEYTPPVSRFLQTVGTPI